MASTETSTAPPPAGEQLEQIEYVPGVGLENEPVLLLKLQDGLARSRLREAFWMSVVLHLLVVIFLINTTKIFPSLRPVQVASAEDLIRQRELTFLELPPDAQKVPKRPDSDIISDKDRISSSRAPSIDRKTLQRLRDSSRPGAPGQPGVTAPPSPPLPQQQASAQQGSQQQQQAPPEVAHNQPGPQSPLSPPPSQNPLTGLSVPPSGGSSSKGAFSAGLSPGAQIAEATRAAAANRGGMGGGVAGDYGLGPGGTQGHIQSQLDILSDTMGVDFGPYLSRVLHAVRMNWYNLIPEEARAPLMKRGKVSIEFAITKNGQIAGMRLAGTSGDVSLDRAAWGGITASNPFAPLPPEFRGEYLALRFHFYYNPDRRDLP
ncbi:MAG TPA: TonB family protein [Terriglobales bacterium]|nr:TonB family protein [Terriglobales bacterium]